MHSPLSILVIDHDSAEVRETIGALTAAGFDVDAVTDRHDLTDPSDLIDRLDRSRPALILLDITLSGTRDSGLLAELRRDARLTDIAVVLMCDPHSCSQQRAEALDRGADDCLVRPLEDDELIARLRARIRRRFTGANAALEADRPAAGTAESDSDGLIMLDRQWRFNHVNGAAERLFRRPQSELKGQRIWDAFPALLETDFERHLRRSVDTAGHVGFHEYFPWLENWFDVSVDPTTEGLSIRFRDIVKSRQTLEDLAASEARFRTLVELAPEPIFVQTRGRFAYANAAALRLHGAERPEQLLGRFVVDCCAPEDRETVAERIRLVNEQRVATPAMDRELLTLSGERRIAAISAVPFTFEGESGALVFARDITERKAAENALAESNKALQLLSHCNEALIRCDDEIELLAEICRVAVELGGFRFAWVGYARDDAARTVEPQAHAGWENGYLSESVFSWAEDRPAGRGPVGCVIRSGQALLWPDLAAESRFQPWAEAALKNGYQGIVCLPLKDADRVFGVLALYFPAARSPQADEVRLWGELADNLAFGIGNLRSQQERRRIEAAVLMMAASVTAVSDEQFFVRLAASMAKAVNAHGGFVARLLPGERPVARTFAAVVDGQVEANFEYALEGTPCEHLFDSHQVVIESRIAEVFPAVDHLRTVRAQAYVGQRLDNSAGQPIGLLYVLFRQSLQRSEWIVSTLRIFAARVAAELERIDADARIRQQAALLDKAQDAILVRDLQHRILYWNRRAERLYGWQAEEVAGRSVRELFYGDDDADFLAATEQTCREGEWVGELVQRTKDGRQLTVEGHWTLVRSDDGEPTSILAINTDITARRELEERFRQSQKIEAVGRLAGGIAHDFNNLLTVITGYSELLLSEPAIDASCREFVLAISEAGQRAAVLTRKLLSFGRQSILQPKIIDLNRVVSKTANMLRRLIGEDILFQTVLEPNLSLVNVDPGQLDQVLINLVVNARDAMPAGGQLTIETAEVTLTEAEAQSLSDCTPGPYVRLSVTDTGCGMPPDVVSQIFEPFFTTKEFGKGTGLGLATVFGIIRQSGGTIDVDSEVGRGTRFQIFLPAVDQR